jgi:polar amino acid transport system substrate-binding protein
MASASAAGNAPKTLMVGFNRRFSPQAIWIRERLARISEPLTISCVVNAGAVPSDSWVLDPEQGGGRIIGEICHFVDLVSFLSGSTPARVYAERLGGVMGGDDSALVTIALANGSIATIIYAAGGHKRYPRERIEVFGGGAVGIIDNFKKASFYLRGKVQSAKSWHAIDRGHKAEMQAFIAAASGNTPPPVDFGDYVATTLATFAMERSTQTGVPERLDYESVAAGERT